MRLLICGLLTFVFVQMLLYARSPDSVVDMWLVTLNSAGQIHIGMTADALVKTTGEEGSTLVDMKLEGTFSPSILVSYKDKKTLVAADVRTDEKNQWVVTRLTIYDSRFHTDSGIHIGSTYSDVKAKYPHSKIISGEGSEALFDTKAGISFILTSERLVQNATVERMIVVASH